MLASDALLLPDEGPGGMSSSLRGILLVTKTAVTTGCELEKDDAETIELQDLAVTTEVVVVVKLTVVPEDVVPT